MGGHLRTSPPCHVQTEGQTVAVSEFTGFATEGEVRRQLSALLKKVAVAQLDVHS